MSEIENQIVVYQPDDIVRIDVCYDGETVWLRQSQIAELFSCSLENVRLHLKNRYASGELEKGATSKESLEVRQEGSRRVSRRFSSYNLDAIISIGYRVNSIVGVRFRQWATRVIKERMLAGAAQTAQFAAIDRRLASHDRARNAARRWSFGIGSRMASRFTAVQDIRNAVAYGKRSELSRCGRSGSYGAMRTSRGNL